MAVETSIEVSNKQFFATGYVPCTFTKGNGDVCMIYDPKLNFKLHIGSYLECVREQADTEKKEKKQRRKRKQLKVIRITFGLLDYICTT